MCRNFIMDESNYQELECYRELGNLYVLKRLKREEQRRARRMQIISNIVNSICWIAVIILLSWIFVSWVEILCHNHSPNPVYQPWNFFVIITDIFKY